MIYPTIKRVKYTHFPSHKNGGQLISVEFDKLSFLPERIFQVLEVLSGEIRGNHARKTTSQYLICMSGKITSTIKDMHGNTESKILTRGDSVYLPPYIWDSQLFHTKHSVLLVLCDTFYSKEDYIEDWDLFCSLLEEKSWLRL